MRTVNKTVKNLTMSAICLALCMVLPMLTGQIPKIGNALSPMHIPVLLCGFVCGWHYAAGIGAVAPLLRFAIFSMPPFLPIVTPMGTVVCGFAMCFELAAYGLVAGLLYKLFPKKPAFVYITLICAMLIGRIVWGVACLIIFPIWGLSFSWKYFVAGAFIDAVPGIILHIVLIPAVVFALRKARVTEK
jgi:thiamine transporter ThiT